MNPVLSPTEHCRVYLYQPEIEGEEIYIEGQVIEIDREKGDYLIQCQKDSSDATSSSSKSCGLNLFSRVGSVIRVPIHPESGEFRGRVKRI